ncbi:MAG: Rubrerythrin [Candidatus Methanofastidiosum methylothiophilum]|uniref:Rubrerythrin n=1 Tax=Candidatus Methanofastidiosum methylothiophilum TaxID=1705564 RepID=A0A150J2E6_9EURY|nr:MAG: Rubrerythrin [Candidatus Methanofastidiosum methylthiophilus]KYC48744.1 MAG: Rubrerythrin [Candidatus Methanofastidiosum methylthiophilus]KYC51392.1 MAG: Rubrerythrin [Candidatus Methanofastidiosum methylthiophilus]
MEKDEKVRIIETAIQAEKETLNTYIKSAIKVSNVVGKNMFLKLALDEIKHREILEKALKSQLEGGECIFPEIEKTEVTKIVPDVEKEIEKTSHLGQDDLAALMLAQKVEKNGIEYYKQCMKNSWDEEAKKMFSYLVKMEEEHYALIQTQIDYIEGTGYWLGIREFTLDD